MATDPLTIATLETQRDVFRLAEFDHGLTRKVVADKSGIHYDTLGTYARGETPMPLTAFQRLCDVIPDHLLSRLLASTGRHIAKNEEAEDPFEMIERGVARLREVRP